MKKYSQPPHREFPGLLPATEENINRLLAGARKRRQERMIHRLLGWVALIICAVLILIFTWVIM